MKVLPTSGRDLRIFLVSLVIALVLNIGKFFQVTSSAAFLGWLLNLLIYTVLIIILIRVVVWIFKKVS